MLVLRLAGLVALVAALHALVGAVGTGGVLRLMLFLALLLAFVGPGIALILAWDYRRTRPATSRRSALLGMIGSSLAVALFVGVPVLLLLDRKSATRFLLTVGMVLGFLFATIFSLSWVLWRGPRGKRPDAIDQE